MTASEFGVAIRNDRALVNSLRGGASVTLATADKIREFMRTYRARSTRTRKRGRGPLGRSAAA